MSVERTVTLTVYAIEADQLDVTTPSDWPHSRFLNGRIRVKARGGGETHEWVLRDGQRCWPGDQVQVIVIEDDPQEIETTDLDPPAIDKRSQSPRYC